MKIQKLNNWIKSQKRLNVMKVHKVGFNIIEGWGINSSEIFNKKKKIFLYKAISIYQPKQKKMVSTINNTKRSWNFRHYQT